MLVVTRKEDQTIFIGPDIRITVCRINGSRVTIGIDAPNELPVSRDSPRAITEHRPTSQPPHRNRINGPGTE